MGRSFTAGDGSGSSFTAQMHRRVSNGQIMLFDVDFNDYCAPPRGARGRFELNGWSPFYVTKSTFDGVTKDVTRTRAEFKIVKLPGNEQLQGKLFSQQFPVPKHIDSEKAKMGQFLKALLGRDFRPGEDIDIDDFIGTQFVTSTTRDEVGDRVYCGISWDVIDPTKTVLSPHLTNPQQPELVMAGGASDLVDPFPPDIDDDL